MYNYSHSPQGTVWKDVKEKERNGGPKAKAKRFANRKAAIEWVGEIGEVGAKLNEKKGK